MIEAFSDFGSWVAARTAGKLLLLLLVGLPALALFGYFGVFRKRRK